MTTAWVAGGTGLVGGELLRLLLADEAFTKVVAVGRRPAPLEDAKLVQATVDFARPESFSALPAPGVAFSCLGTTIKKAGSREAFRAVDHDAVVAFATAAHAKGAEVLVHVSSLGADPRSRTFYAAVKGETERALAALGYDSVYALRPSILDGERSESRPLERVG
ncbi:MAG: Nucleoside-diphosphate-sugar epimerase, partial [Labilithrix sp.]|nr:Nucleoside-diphosphate-sugar epimerase [Labilithrix sp.]